MTNYQQGKIYKIESINGQEGDIYIGSTCKQFLSQRMEKHRSSYKGWKNNIANFLTAFNLFDKHGVENCRIVLIENCPCNSKDELYAREAFYIKASKCINRNIPLRTREEYYQDNIVEAKRKNIENKLLNKDRNSALDKIYCQENKEIIAEKHKKYYQENKEQLNEKNRIYNEKHADEIKEYKKIHYQANKEKIQEKLKEKVTCECGSICNQGSLSEHKKTKKHTTYINSL